MDKFGINNWRNCIAAACLGIMSVALTAQAIPPINQVIAIMQDAPRQGHGLKLIDAVNSISYVRTIYRVFKPASQVEVYVSRDPRGFNLGPTNIRFQALIGSSAVGSPEYRVLQGKPSYCLQRADGMWFLFVFPDEPVDVALFVQLFGECFGFFEARLKNARIEDILPAVLGSLQAKP